MNQNELERLRGKMIEMASYQGRRIREYVEAGAAAPHRQKSSQGDLVTNLDEEIERDLQVQLTALIPEASFLGEESSGSTDSAVSWVVDPIDGTTNVIHGVKHAAVSIALLEGYTTVIGVVYSVFEDVVYSSIRDRGAYRKVPDSQELQLARIETSTVASLKNSLLSFGLPYDRSKSDTIFVAASRLFSACQDLRRSGSAALDLVAIAVGESEGHFEVDLRLWDFAAAALILEEAGGTITTWSGQPLNLSDPHGKFSVLASNSRVHRVMGDLLSGVGPA
jgi:myo-inositol-1(or 4)-monophosphatase